MPKSSNNPGDTFEKTLNRAIELVLLGKAHLRVGRGIGQIVTSDPAISLAAPTFWGLTITAHLDSAQLLAFKLFDPRKGTLTVEYLLSQAEAHPEIFQNANPDQANAVVQIARNLIASLTNPLAQLRARRNRLIAHLDATAVHDPQKLMAATSITFSDLNRIFSVAENIVGEAAVKFRGISVSFDLLDVSDYESVAQLVAKAKCAQIKAYEAEFGAWSGPRPKDCPPE